MGDSECRHREWLCLAWGLGRDWRPHLAEARQRAGGKTRSRIVNGRLGQEIVIRGRWRCKTCNLRHRSFVAAGLLVCNVYKDVPCTVKFGTAGTRQSPCPIADEWRLHVRSLLRADLRVHRQVSRMNCDAGFSHVI